VRSHAACEQSQTVMTFVTESDECWMLTLCAPLLATLVVQPRDDASESLVEVDPLQVRFFNGKTDEFFRRVTAVNNQ